MLRPHPSPSQRPYNHPTPHTLHPHNHFSFPSYPSPSSTSTQEKDITHYTPYGHLPHRFVPPTPTDVPHQLSQSFPQAETKFPLAGSFPYELFSYSGVSGTEEGVNVMGGEVDDNMTDDETIELSSSELKDTVGEGSVEPYGSERPVGSGAMVSQPQHGVQYSAASRHAYVDSTILMGGIGVQPERGCGQQPLLMQAREESQQTTREMRGGVMNGELVRGTESEFQNSVNEDADEESVGMERGSVGVAGTSSRSGGTEYSVQPVMEVEEPMTADVASSGANVLGVIATDGQEAPIDHHMTMCAPPVVYTHTNPAAMELTAANPTTGFLNNISLAGAPYPSYMIPSMFALNPRAYQPDVFNPGAFQPQYVPPHFQHQYAQFQPHSRRGRNGSTPYIQMPVPIPRPMYRERFRPASFQICPPTAMGDAMVLERSSPSTQGSYMTAQEPTAAITSAVVNPQLLVKTFDRSSSRLKSSPDSPTKPTFDESPPTHSLVSPISPHLEPLESPPHLSPTSPTKDITTALQQVQSLTREVARRRSKNTEAARRSRQKKLGRMKALEIRNKEMEGRVVEYERMLREREREVEELGKRERKLEERVRDLEGLLNEAHRRIVEK
ncbi:hypothetical protein HK097_007778 [Rhizophlyctis rosea]|uniref:BZIP domain-containing protein n=1 Tax=Rhizophlyctis rosea TaxID=64517 RepID=A0AAD5X1F7_9FUNG|nr:hypothetical protein HK097_007778 [Rhizophlyctis rosea]